MILILEWVLIRLAYLIVVLFLVTLALGPSRTWRFFQQTWAWLTGSKQEPAAVLERVLRQHEKAIRELQGVLEQSEAAQKEIARNVRRCQEEIASLQREARNMAVANNDLGARAALYKLNLEQLALQGFQEQAALQAERISASRRRLHLLELQLRQYEVGRSILLAQLAEARTVEQQYALACQFDPFSAVAAWKQAEGNVQETARDVRAVEQVYQDTADLPLSGRSVRIDPETLDQQLAELKQQVRRSDEAGSRG